MNNNQKAVKQRNKLDNLLRGKKKSLLKTVSSLLAGENLTSFVVLYL